MPLIATDSHPIDEADYRDACRATLQDAGALVLDGFFSAEMIERVVADYTDTAWADRARERLRELETARAAAADDPPRSSP